MTLLTDINQTSLNSYLTGDTFIKKYTWHRKTLDISYRVLATTDSYKTITFWWFAYKQQIKPYLAGTRCVWVYNWSKDFACKSNSKIFSIGVCWNFCNILLWNSKVKLRDIFFLTQRHFEHISQLWNTCIWPRKSLFCSDSRCTYKPIRTSLLLTYDRSKFFADTKIFV